MVWYISGTSVWCCVPWPGTSVVQVCSVVNHGLVHQWYKYHQCKYTSQVISCILWYISYRDILCPIIVKENFQYRTLLLLEAIWKCVTVLTGFGNELSQIFPFGIWICPVGHLETEFIHWHKKLSITGLAAAVSMKTICSTQCSSCYKMVQ